MSEMINRRGVVTALWMSGVWTAMRVNGAGNFERPVLVRVGFLSDPHYANVPYSLAGDDRFFSASLVKLKAAVAKFNELKLDLAIEGGDLADWSRVDGDVARGSGTTDRLTSDVVRGCL